MNNKKIIPVTHEIRNYLNNQMSKEEEVEELKKYGLNKEIYTIRREVGKLTIVNKEAESKKVQQLMEKKLVFLEDVARKMKKSLVWIYQEMVMCGYGEYIDENSDIYQAALLANNDIQNILEKSSEAEAIWYEDIYILNEKVNDEKIKPKKRIRKKNK